MSHRPFRFGVQISDAPDAGAWRDHARRAEDLGYAVLSVADHLDDQFAPVPALVAAADATSSIRLGAMVLCNDYRHPVVLAKEAATIDLLSDGRFELGMGAGWMTTDYRAAGIPLDPPAMRIERLSEAVDIVTGLLEGRTVTHTGVHYRVDGQVGTPRPVQRPRPPLLLGGGGRRMLTLAAQVADIVALNISLTSGRIDESAGPSATAEATDARLGWIRAAAGERFADLEIQTRIHLAAITDDRRGLAEAVGPALGLTAEQAMVSPHGLGGSVAEIVEQCHERRERWGISYLTLSGDVMEEMAPVVAALAGT